MTFLPDQLQSLNSQSAPSQPILCVGNADWLQLAQEIQKKMQVHQVDVVTVADPPSIKDLTEKLERIYYQPKNSQYSLLFLFGVDFWSQFALNKLLKLIEEPPQFLKIFLFAQKSSGILPTILSRIQVIRLKNNPEGLDIISLKKIKALTLVQALEEVRLLVEKHNASAIMKHWMNEIGTEEFNIESAEEITKKMALAGNQPVNQKMLLESVIFKIKLLN